MTTLAWLLAAYLLGSIPFSLLAVRVSTGKDVREAGSGNVGATNALRVGGVGAGAVALAGDVGKGVAVVLAARLWGGSPVLTGIVAAAVVVGHVYPLFLGFRGGKGVATAGGALGALAPYAFLLSLVVFLVLVFSTRYVSLGSLGAVLTFPLFVWLLHGTERGGWFLAVATLVPILIVWRHRENIARLLRGEERRFGQGHSPRREKEERS